MESALAFSSWRIPHTEQQNGSFLDVNRFHKTVLFFTVASKVEVNQNFYKLTSPKYPLKLSLKLAFVGKSSYVITSTLGSPGQDSPYATFSFTEVMVDPKTRLPTPGPDWWREKYANISGQTPPSRLRTLQRPEHARCFSFRVVYSGTDHNYHAHWSTYIRACYDAFMENALKKTYENVSEKEAAKGVKYMELLFQKESNIGDNLDVFSWETDNKENKELAFEIVKGSSVCLYARMGFHENKINEGATLSSKLWYRVYKLTLMKLIVFTQYYYTWEMLSFYVLQKPLQISFYINYKSLLTTILSKHIASALTVV